jgi:hypothetical protein
MNPGETTSEPTYVVESDYFRTGQVSDIDLSVTPKGLSRRVLRCELIDNPKNKQHSVKACVVHQKRKSVDDAWQDLDGTSLQNTTVLAPSKFPLDSAETWQLFDHLRNLYDIGADGIQRGRVVVQLSNAEEVIRTDSSRADVIRRILDAEHGEEVWDLLVQLQPDLAAKLTSALRFQRRTLAVEEFERRINQKLPEDDWKAFLKKHAWMFGGSIVKVIDEPRLDIKNTTDIPFEVEGGFMDIVELKRPDSPFWASRGGAVALYRDKYPVPAYELQGAIAQAANYILQAEKQVSDTDFVQLHGVVPLKPRGLVVHGRSDGWTDTEWRAFRLLNDNLHGIQVMTFDHLLAQARRTVRL